MFLPLALQVHKVGVRNLTLILREVENPVVQVEGPGSDSHMNKKLPFGQNMEKEAKCQARVHFIFLSDKQSVSYGKLN